MSPRLALSLRIVLPAIWIGLIIAIDLIEAPLKFQAPGITIPLGLGIGRLVFFAMNIAEVIIAVILALALWRPRADRRTWTLFGGLVLMLAVKLLVIRPFLWERTDQVLAETGEEGSVVHYFYIAADAVIAVLLVWFVITQVRRIIPTSTAAPTALEH